MPSIGPAPRGEKPPASTAPPPPKHGQKAIYGGTRLRVEAAYPPANQKESLSMFGPSESRDFGNALMVSVGILLAIGASIGAAIGAAIAWATWHISVGWN